MAPIEVIAAARRCVGARFRLHGRSIEAGLDCVGVAALAFGVEAPGGYPLRGGTASAIAARIDTSGLRRVSGDPRPGDLMLIEAGPYQHHLLIRTDRGFVHADAGLRRVVEVPGPPAWPPIALWRAQTKER
jgi:lipoprotein Spr